MSSTLLLEQEVTTTLTTTQAGPVFTVEGAFLAAGCTIMPQAVRHRLKDEAAIAVYSQRFGRLPSKGALNRMQWRWNTRPFWPSMGVFETLNPRGVLVTEVADPIFVVMAGRLGKELAKVPGAQVEHVVESLFSDPFGGVRITLNGETTTYWYYSWFGNKTIWPPSRG